MISTAISPMVATTSVLLATVVGTITLLAIRELADPSRRKVPIIVKGHLGIFSIPLLILCVYIIIVDVANSAFS